MDHRAHGDHGGRGGHGGHGGRGHGGHGEHRGHGRHGGHGGHGEHGGHGGHGEQRQQLFDQINQLTQTIALLQTQLNGLNLMQSENNKLQQENIQLKQELAEANQKLNNEVVKSKNIDLNLDQNQELLIQINNLNSQVIKDQTKRDEFQKQFEDLNLSISKQQTDERQQQFSQLSFEDFISNSQQNENIQQYKYLIRSFQSLYLLKQIDSVLTSDMKVYFKQGLCIYETLEKDLIEKVYTMIDKTIADFKATALQISKQKQIDCQDDIQAIETDAIKFEYDPIKIQRFSQSTLINIKSEYSTLLSKLQDQYEKWQQIEIILKH